MFYGLRKFNLVSGIDVNPVRYLLVAVIVVVVLSFVLLPCTIQRCGNKPGQHLLSRPLIGHSAPNSDENDIDPNTNTMESTLVYPETVGGTLHDTVNSAPSVTNQSPANHQDFMFTTCASSMVYPE